MKVKLAQNCSRCWKSETVKGQIVCGGLAPGEGCPEIERQQLKARREKNGLKID